MKSFLFFLLFALQAYAQSSITFSSGSGYSASRNAVNFFGSGVPPITTVLLDTFHDTNGTELSNHTCTTPASKCWTKAGSAANIQGNVLVGVAGQTDPLYVADTGVTAGTLTADLVLDLADTQVNLYVGTNSAGSSAVGYIIICYPVLNQIQFYHSGVLSPPGTVPYTFSAGAQEWTVVLTATQLRFYIDGSLVTPALTITPESSYFGLEAYHPGGTATPGSTWSMFKVTTP